MARPLPSRHWHAPSAHSCHYGVPASWCGAFWLANSLVVGLLLFFLNIKKHSIVFLYILSQYHTFFILIFSHFSHFHLNFFYLFPSSTILFSYKWTRTRIICLGSLLLGLALQISSKIINVSQFQTLLHRHPTQFIFLILN